MKNHETKICRECGKPLDSASDREIEQNRKEQSQDVDAEYQRIMKMMDYSRNKLRNRGFDPDRDEWGNQLEED